MMKKNLFKKEVILEKIISRKNFIRERFRSKKEVIKKIARGLVLVLILIILIGFILYFLEKSFKTPENFATQVRQMGALGPLIVIILIALEVVVAPIPGYFVAVGSGYAFGTLWGTLYSYIGNIIGTAIAFYLSRNFGRPIVEYFVNKKKLETYDLFLKEKGRVALWFVYIFPIFPTDIISFITGLSDIKWKDFMIIVCIGYLPNMLLLNYFGANLYESGFSMISLFLGAIILSCLLFGLFFYLQLRKKTVQDKKQE